VPLSLVPQQIQRIQCHVLDHHELKIQSLEDQDDFLSVFGAGVLFAFCLAHCLPHHCLMCRQMMGLNSLESRSCTPSADEEEPPFCGVKYIVRLRQQCYQVLEFISVLRKLIE
jgi:hypothetical protein